MKIIVDEATRGLEDPGPQYPFLWMSGDVALLAVRDGVNIVLTTNNGVYYTAGSPDGSPGDFAWARRVRYLALRAERAE